MGNKRTMILIGIIITIAILSIIIMITSGIQSVEKEEIIDFNSIEIDNEDGIDENTVAEEKVEEEILPVLHNKGEIAKERSNYTDEDKVKVTVPAGFAVIKDTQNVREGLVISDVADDDLGNSKGGNQFVWIPVNTPTLNVTKCKNEDEINSEISKSVAQRNYPMAIKLPDGNYKGVLYKFKAINENTAIKADFIPYSESASEREPANLKDNEEYISGWTQDLYQNEYNKLVERVQRDQGFWIARYETSVNSNNIAQSKKNYKPLTNVSWYELYKVEKSLSNDKVSSQMIWGSQWDQVINWMRDTRNTENREGGRYFILNSVNMGNYLNSEIELEGTENTEENQKNVKSINEALILKTGESEKTKIKNIYDMAGNVWEWTMEGNFTNSRNARGGDCSYDGTVYPVSSRFSFSSTFNEERLRNIGSRMTIY